MGYTSHNGLIVRNGLSGKKAPNLMLSEKWALSAKRVRRSKSDLKIRANRSRRLFARCLRYAAR